MQPFFSLLLTHMGLALFVTSLLAMIWVLWAMPRPLTKSIVIDVALSYLLLFCVGGYGLYGFILHAFFPHTAATLFGWPSGSYQLVLAMVYFGLGLLAISGYRRVSGYQFVTGFMGVCVFWGMALSQAYGKIIVHEVTLASALFWFISEALLPLSLLLLLLCSNYSEVGRHNE